jgi:hypothetical protein
LGTPNRGYPRRRGQRQTRRRPSRHPRQRLQLAGQRPSPGPPAPRADAGASPGTRQPRKSTDKGSRRRSGPSRSPHQRIVEGAALGGGAGRPFMVSAPPP